MDKNINLELLPKNYMAYNPTALCVFLQMNKKEKTKLHSSKHVICQGQSVVDGEESLDFVNKMFRILA